MIKHLVLILAISFTYSIGAFGQVGVEGEPGGLIKDSQTGISFTTPINFEVVHYDLWLSVRPEGVDEKLKTIYWNVFNSSYYTGPIKDRCIQFASTLAASDGTEGGTVAKPEYLETVKSKSNDDVVLFKLTVSAHGDASSWNGRPAGYMLGVELKKIEPKKDHHFLLFSPNKKTLLEIAKSIDVPKKLSIR